MVILLSSARTITNVADRVESGTECRSSLTVEFLMPSPNTRHYIGGVEVSLSFSSFNVRSSHQRGYCFSLSG